MRIRKLCMVHNSSPEDLFGKMEDGGQHLTALFILFGQLLQQMAMIWAKEI